MNKVTCVSFLLIVLLTLTLGLDSVYGQAPSFSIRGNVTEADGTAVGEGYTVKGVNQRVSSWSIYTDGRTRADGSYTDIMFMDFFGKTTNVGDQIVLTVDENATGQTKGRKVYTVTQQMVTAMSASVEIRLSGIMAEFSPSSEVLADGTSSLQVTVTVQDETGELVKDDSLTLESSKGSVIGNIVNNGDGTYSTTYSPLSLVISGSVSDSLKVTSSKLNQSVLETVTLLEVPTVVTLSVSDKMFQADESKTSSVTVTVKRGTAVKDETIEISAIRTDGVSDAGLVSDVVNNGDGTYSATYTPPKVVGQVSLSATAKKSGVSSTAVSITTNAGPASSLVLV